MKLMARLNGFTLGALLATTVATGALAQGMGPGQMGGQMRAGTFAKIDTNGDKLLSPDEIRAWEAAQIKGLDANGDGVLTVEEITAKMTQMDQQRLVLVGTRLAARLGTDGKVSVDALAKMPTPIDRVVARMLEASGGKISEATFVTFEAMGGMMGPGGHGGGWQGDRQGDRGGRGDHGGWGRHDHMGGPGRMGGAGKSGGPGMNGGPGMGFGMQVIKFSDIDTNGDGYITAEEIQAYKLSRLKAMDANSDGFITPDEFAAYMVAQSGPRIAQRAEALVTRLDLNGDGKLTIEELAAAPFDMMFAHLPTDAQGNVTEAAFLAAGHGRGHGQGDHGGWRGGRHGGQGGMMPPPPAPEGN